jgi:beta-fructofuranosidase
MALGAGSATGHPSVLQYSSTDLRRWQPDGVLAEPTAEQPGPGGEVWECPQLFRIEDTWALVVSVWNQEPGTVACALGDYDGRRFTPRAWHELAGAPCYATTVFRDAVGRPSAFSWLRNTGHPGGEWAGALSVPWLLATDGDRVVVRPHPDVDSLRTGVAHRRGGGPIGATPLTVRMPVHADVELRARTAGKPLVLTLDDGNDRLLTVVADPAAGDLAMADSEGGHSRAPLHPGPDGQVELRLLVDAAVVEAFPGGGGVAAARLRSSGEELLMGLTTQGTGCRLDDLVVHGMERALG